MPVGQSARRPISDTPASLADAIDVAGERVDQDKASAATQQNGLAPE
jgi:hypothetical protein